METPITKLQPPYTSTPLSDEIFDLFDDMGKSFPKIMINNEREGKNEIELFKSKLIPFVEWKEKYHAVIRIIGAIYGGGFQYNEFSYGLSKLCYPIIDLLKNIRIDLVKVTSVLISLMADYAGPKFRCYGNYVFEVLPQLSHIDQKNRECAGLILRHIAYNCPTTSMLIQFIQITKSPKIHVRSIGAECISLVLRRWPLDLISSNYGSIESCLSRLSQDSAEEPRIQSRYAIKAYELCDQKRATEFKKSLDKRNIKMIDSTPSFHQDSSIRLPSSGIKTKEAQKIKSPCQLSPSQFLSSSEPKDDDDIPESAKGGPGVPGTPRPCSHSNPKNFESDGERISPLNLQKVTRRPISVADEIRMLSINLSKPSIALTDVPNPGAPPDSPSRRYLEAHRFYTLSEIRNNIQNQRNIKSNPEMTYVGQFKKLSFEELPQEMLNEEEMKNEDVSIDQKQNNQDDVKKDLSKQPYSKNVKKTWKTMVKRENRPLFSLDFKNVSNNYTKASPENNDKEIPFEITNDFVLRHMDTIPNDLLHCLKFTPFGEVTFISINILKKLFSDEKSNRFGQYFSGQLEDLLNALLFLSQTGNAKISKKAKDVLIMLPEVKSFDLLKMLRFLIEAPPSSESLNFSNIILDKIQIKSEISSVLGEDILVQLAKFAFNGRKANEEASKMILEKIPTSELEICGNMVFDNYLDEYKKFVGPNVLVREPSIVPSYRPESPIEWRRAIQNLIFSTDASHWESIREHVFFEIETALLSGFDNKAITSMCNKIILEKGANNSGVILPGLMKSKAFDLVREIYKALGPEQFLIYYQNAFQTGDNQTTLNSIKFEKEILGEFDSSQIQRLNIPVTLFQKLAEKLVPFLSCPVSQIRMETTRCLSSIVKLTHLSNLEDQFSKLSDPQKQLIIKYASI